MIRFTPRGSLHARCLTLLVLATLAGTSITPGIPIAQTTGDSSDRAVSKFDEVIKLKVSGEYDLAIAKLREIIKEYANSDQVLRRAYTELVAIYDEKGDTDSALQAARLALEKYPDLTADPNWFPSKINGHYARLRKEMFGSLKIEGRPEGCRIFLNGKYFGTTVLHLDLIRAGEYDLKLTKRGRPDYDERILIQPGVPSEKVIDIPPGPCGWGCWTKRVAAGVGGVAAVVYVVALILADDEPPPDLPSPPAPPTN